MQPWRRACPHHGLHGLCTTLPARPEVLGASLGWVWDAHRVLALFRTPTAALARRSGSRDVSHPMQRAFGPNVVPSPVSVHGAMLGPTTSPGHLPAQEQPVGVLLHRGDTERHKFPLPLVENQAGSQQTWGISPVAPLAAASHLSSPPAAGIRGQKPLSACSKLKSVVLITCPGGRSNEVRPGDEQAHLPAGAAGGVCVRACVRAACAASRIGCETPLQPMRGTGVA